MLEIRLMLAAEQNAVARLFHDAWHETQAQLQDPRIGRFRDFSFFLNRVQQRAERTLVAHMDGKLAGFTCWTGDHLNSLFVAPSFRSHSVGEGLLAAAEAEMKKTAARPFHLTCICGNEAGRRFYERHGWRVAREEQLTDELPGGRALVQSWVMKK